jgi:hypothetical protein
VGSLDLLGLPTFLELLVSKLVDGLEHHESRLPVRSLLLPEEALAQKGGDAIEGIDGQIAFCVADDLYRLEGSPPGEDREPGEE